MKEKPILFSGEMVKAVLENRKTQTRRIIFKGNPIDDFYTFKYFASDSHSFRACFELTKRIKHMPLAMPYFGKKCPYGQPGDRLWVRETWKECTKTKINRTCLAYKAGREVIDFGMPVKWKPSIHMPRWASRITLEIVNVRVERLQDISEEDALAEGVNKISHAGEYFYHHSNKFPNGGNWVNPEFAFEELWNKLNGPGAWEKNPWVWVIEFKRVLQ